MDRLNREVKLKRPHRAKNKVMFHHNNAISYSSTIATAKPVDLRYEMLNHLLFPAITSFFPNTRKWLIGRRFKTDLELTSDILGALEKYYNQEGIKLQHLLTIKRDNKNKWHTLKKKFFISFLPDLSIYVHSYKIKIFKKAHTLMKMLHIELKKKTKKKGKFY